MTQMLSVPLPDELKEELDKHKEIKWVEVARQALREKVEALHAVEEIMAKSKVDEKDAARHADIVKKKVWKRHKHALGE